MYILEVAFEECLPFCCRWKHETFSLLKCLHTGSTKSTSSAALAFCEHQNEPVCGSQCSDGLIFLCFVNVTCELYEQAWSPQDKAFFLHHRKRKWHHVDHTKPQTSHFDCEKKKFLNKKGSFLLFLQSSEWCMMSHRLSKSHRVEMMITLKRVPKYKTWFKQRCYVFCLFQGWFFKKLHVVL